MRHRQPYDIKGNFALEHLGPVNLRIGDYCILGIVQWKQEGKVLPLRAHYRRSLPQLKKDYPNPGLYPPLI